MVSLDKDPHPFGDREGLVTPCAHGGTAIRLPWQTKQTVPVAAHLDCLTIN